MGAIGLRPRGAERKWLRIMPTSLQLSFVGLGRKVSRVPGEPASQLPGEPGRAAGENGLGVGFSNRRFVSKPPSCYGMSLRTFSASLMGTHQSATSEPNHIGGTYYAVPDAKRRETALDGTPYAVIRKFHMSPTQPRDCPRWMFPANNTRIRLVPWQSLSRRMPCLCIFFRPTTAAVTLDSTASSSFQTAARLFTLHVQQKRLYGAHPCAPVCPRVLL